MSSSGPRRVVGAGAFPDAPAPPVAMAHAPMSTASKMDNRAQRVVRWLGCVG